MRNKILTERRKIEAENCTLLLTGNFSVISDDLIEKISDKFNSRVDVVVTSESAKIHREDLKKLAQSVCEIIILDSSGFEPDCDIKNINSKYDFAVITTYSKTLKGYRNIVRLADKYSREVYWTTDGECFLKYYFGCVPFYMIQILSRIMFIILFLPVFIVFYGIKYYFGSKHV